MKLGVELWSKNFKNKNYEMVLEVKGFTDRLWLPQVQKGDTSLVDPTFQEVKIFSEKK